MKLARRRNARRNPHGDMMPLVLLGGAAAVAYYGYTQGWFTSLFPVATVATPAQPASATSIFPSNPVTNPNTTIINAPPSPPAAPAPTPTPATPALPQYARNVVWGNITTQLNAGFLTNDQAQSFYNQVIAAVTQSDLDNITQQIGLYIAGNKAIMSAAANAATTAANNAAAVASGMTGLRGLRGLGYWRM